MSIVAMDIKTIGGREASGPYDSMRLCSYGKLLASVAKERREEEPDDDLTPEQLEEKAEKLLAGMRAARR
jgi:hypothetical protein